MANQEPIDDDRVLIFAPIGRDAVLTRAILLGAGLTAAICERLDDVCAGIESGAGAILLTEEALSDPHIGDLAAALAAQPSWSDISILLFTGGDRTSTALHTLTRLEVLRNVTLLDRPMRVAAVISTVQAALRGRRRQYELREVLVALHSARTEAERANRLKDEFLATLSHELRTPLNAIVGWVSMLRRAQVPEEQVARVLEIVERNARAQMQLIADVLDVSHMITGRIRLQLEPIPLANVIADAIDSVRPAADVKGVAVSTHIDADDSTVHGDAERLQQVLWNLLSNAIKFTPGGGSVDVRVSREGSMIRCDVVDTGIGLAPEFLPYAFDRFRQADQTFSRRHGGLGLGLAIVKHLVEMHGGQVTAQSAGSGTGATFSIRLPVAAVGADVRSTGDEDVAADRPDLAGQVILVVDDDATTRELLTAMLESHGARVRQAASASAALEELDREIPALVVADIGMPDEDGLSMMRRIRQRLSTHGGTTPAVALSAYARAEDRLTALDAGFDDFLTKPALPADVLRTISQCLRNRKPDNGGLAATASTGRHAD